MTTRPIRLLALSIAWFAGAGIEAWASNPQNVTETEMALLPPYCRDTPNWDWTGGARPLAGRQGYWEEVLGHTLRSIHHHCWGLIELRRAERSGVPSIQRQGLRESALADFWYVINNSPNDFVLRPEIFTYIGRAETMLRHPAEAIEAFRNAQKAKPDYWPAYFHWVELLRSAGRNQEALAVVREGLKNAPTAKLLLQQYKALGGKPADIPKPAPREEEPVEPAPAPQQTSAPTNGADSQTPAKAAETVPPPEAKSPESHSTTKP